MTPEEDPCEALGGGDVDPDYGPVADEYEWLCGADDPDRPSRWRDGEEATRDDDERTDDDGSE